MLKKFFKLIIYYQFTPIILKYFHIQTKKHIR